MVVLDKVQKVSPFAFLDFFIAKQVSPFPLN